MIVSATHGFQKRGGDFDWHPRGKPRFVCALSDDCAKPARCGIIGNGAVQTGKITKTTEKALSQCLSHIYSITYFLALS